MVNGAEGALTSLIKKNIFEVYDREAGRLTNVDNENKISQLNEIQQEVLDSIQQQFFAKECTPSIVKNQAEQVVIAATTSTLQKPKLNKEVVLLHGVTSSGKTEI
jgi:primosomal protein N'